MRKTSEKISSMNNLINLFKDFIDEDDIVSAQILSKLSSKIVKYRLDNNMNQKQFYLLSFLKLLTNSYHHIITSLYTIYH